MWGRQFAPPGVPLLLPARAGGWGPLIALLLLLLLVITVVRLSVLLSYWQNDLFTALQKLDPSAFLRAILVFVVLVGGLGGRPALLAYYASSGWRSACASG